MSSLALDANKFTQSDPQCSFKESKFEDKFFNSPFNANQCQIIDITNVQGEYFESEDLHYPKLQFLEAEL